jgi:DnaJ-class molecular chaperone
MTLDIVECGNCNGSGVVFVSPDLEGLLEETCSECDGVGFTRDDGTKLRPQEVV